MIVFFVNRIFLFYCFDFFIASFQAPEKGRWICSDDVFSFYLFFVCFFFHTTKNSTKSRIFKIKLPKTKPILKLKFFSSIPIHIRPLIPSSISTTFSFSSSSSSASLLWNILDLFFFLVMVGHGFQALITTSSTLTSSGWLSLQNLI